MYMCHRWCTPKPGIASRTSCTVSTPFSISRALPGWSEPQFSFALPLSRPVALVGHASGWPVSRSVDNKDHGLCFGSIPHDFAQGQIEFGRAPEATTGYNGDCEWRNLRRSSRPCTCSLLSPDMQSICKLLDGGLQSLALRGGFASALADRMPTASWH